jgi:hypothetical protein
MIRDQLDVSKGAMVLLHEFLEKISPLRSANKLGVVLIIAAIRYV